MNHAIKQRVIVGTIKAGVVAPSLTVAAYIAARERNLTQPSPTMVRAAWDAMTDKERADMDALLIEASR